MTFVNGVGEFFKNLGSTLKALAGSRKVVLTGLGVIINAAVPLFPSATWLPSVIPYVDLGFTVLVVAIAIEDGLSAAATVSSADPSKLLATIALAGSLTNPATTPAAADKATGALADSLPKTSPAKDNIDADLTSSVG